MNSSDSSPHQAGISLVRKTIRIGIVGCGQLVREVHLPILSRMRPVEVCALCDTNASSLDACRGLAPEAVRCFSIEALLAHPHLDAVVVASPSAQHARHAIAVLHAGKALYLEKPMACSLAEARSILAAAEQNNQAAMMGFNYRFHPLVQVAKQKLRGRKISAARSSFSIAPRPLPEWKMHRESGGGALLDFGSHHLDLLTYIFDQPVSAIEAEISSQKSEQDTARLTIHFANGSIASAFYCLCGDEEDRIEIESEGRTIRVARYEPFDFPLFPLHKFLRYQIDRLRAPWHEVSFQLSLAAWCNSIQIGSTPPITLNDGYKCMLAIEAAESSALSGKIARLEQ